MESSLPTEQKHYTKIQTRLSVAFAIVSAVVATIVAIAIYLDARAHLYDQFRNQALAMVNLSEEKQYPNLLEEINNPADAETSVYKFLQQENSKLVDADFAIGSIYVMRQTSMGSIYFVVDAVSRDLAETKPPANYGEVYQDPGPVLAENFDSMAQAMVEEGFYTDDWGTWLSAYTPIFKDDGTQVGILGLDLSAEVVTTAEKGMLTTFLIILAASLPLFALTGWLFGSFLARPIIQLTDSVKQITEGDLKHRAEIKTGDEIERLADSFNLMADRTNDLIEGLEARVSVRTAELTQKTGELELASAILLRRANELRAVSDVARSISNVRDTQQLLPYIAQIISEKFDFYHVGIFINDSTNEYATLRASNSEGGARMLARQHKLRIGQVGLVGNVAASGRTRIALDTGADAAYFNNPDLPETHSEIALPLKSGKKTIGVLDVQSNESNAFSQEDAEILGTLADLVSIAISNAEVFSESQKAMAEAQMYIQQYTRTEWMRFATEKTSSGYRYSIGEIQPLTEPVDLSGGQTKESDAAPALVRIPILVHGETIGEIGINLPSNRSLDTDEEDIARAISERIALAIENARLLEDTQKRATKERTIGEISARISGSTNMESVMETAVRELGRIMPGSKVTIHLEDDNNQ